MNTAPNPTKELRSLIDGLLADSLTRSEFARLEELLEENPIARRQYLEIVGNEALLKPALKQMREVPTAQDAPAISQRGSFSGSRFIALAAAACLALAAGIWALGYFAEPADQFADVSVGEPVIVARLESASEAVWGGLSPGATVGAPLNAGMIELREGVAELRFESGVLLALEAPARIDLIDPMRCRLYTGTAVLDVPESGHGFVVETSEGHAVDHGTRFAVIISQDSSSADFEVLEGNISVFHGKSGQMMPLADAQAVRVSESGFKGLDTLPSQQLTPSREPNHLRLSTLGKEACIVRDQLTPREKILSPELLMVKRDLPKRSPQDRKGTEHPKDRRSLVGFKLDAIDPQRVVNAALSLNLVPSGLGFASLLPEVSTFEVYGIRDDSALESWSPENLAWDQAPGSVGWKEALDLGAVHRLGSFEIPRGKTSGEILFNSPELLAFVREDTTGEVGFLIVRVTPPLGGWSLVHAFASSFHPTAAGPALELEFEFPQP